MAVFYVNRHLVERFTIANIRMLRSQETLKSSCLMNVFFLLFTVENSYGNAYTTFRCFRTSDNEFG